MSTGDLELSIEKLEKIASYAERVMTGNDEEKAKMARILLIVTACLHRKQISEPESYSGSEIDRWHDQIVGQTWRMRWMEVKPAIEKLEALGSLD
jgi:hypothetical protein